MKIFKPEKNYYKKNKKTLSVISWSMKKTTKILTQTIYFNKKKLTQTHMISKLNIRMCVKINKWKETPKIF